MADLSKIVDHGWREALADFKLGRPDELAQLLRDQSLAPQYVMSVLADFIDGKLRVDRRGADKSRLTTRERNKMARIWRAAQTQLEGMRRDAQELADAHGIEPDEVLGIAARAREALLLELKNKFGVGPETIRKSAGPKKLR